MNEPKISVITPVHDSEEYLRRCVDSILSQTLEDIEVILIDDASEDGSFGILKSYADSDPRVLIIKLDENKGPGGARNLGIEAARGEYLSFVDSDDMIAPDFLELLYAKAAETSADIIKGSCFEVFANDLDSESGMLKMRHQNDFISRSMRSGKSICEFFSNWHFSAVYRRDFIIKNNIRYGNTIVGEDSVFLLMAGVLSDSFVFEPSAKYYHYHREESQSRILSKERFESSSASLKEQFSFLESARIKPEAIVNTAVRKLRFGLRIHSCLRFFEYPEVDAEKYAQRLYELASGFKYADALAEDDYAISVFLSSKGTENISLLGKSASFDNEIEVKLADLERLARHIADAPAQQDQAIKYLAIAIKEVRKSPSFRDLTDEREFHQWLVDSMNKKLSCLNTPELLPLLPVGVRALVEYGVDLMPTKPGILIIESFKDGVAAMSKTVDLLSDHPDAASEYYDFAVSFYNSLLLASSSSQIKSDKQFGAVLARFTLAADSLNRLIEKKKNGELS